MEREPWKGSQEMSGECGECVYRVTKRQECRNWRELGESTFTKYVSIFQCLLSPRVNVRM